MTTRTIRYTLLDGNALPDGTPTRAAMDRLVDAVADALAAAFPGAEVTVDVARRTSGYSRPAHLGWDADYRDEELAEATIQRAWEAWANTVTDEDYERPEVTR